METDLDEAVVHESVYDDSVFGFLQWCREHKDVDWEQEVDDCKAISTIESGSIIKHKCGCFSESERTHVPARKIGRKLGQELIDKIAAMRKRINR